MNKRGVIMDLNRTFGAQQATNTSPGWGSWRATRRHGGQSAMRWAGAAQGVSQSPNAPRSSACREASAENPVLGRCLSRLLRTLALRRALVATLSTPKHETAGTWSDVERRQDSAMQAAQSVLLIVADDMQPSDIHALRHLHAPPILAETPWQALEHVPMWNFEPQ